MDNSNSSEQIPKKNFHISLLIVLVLVAAVEFVLLLKKDGKLPMAVSTNFEETSQVPDEVEGVVEGSFIVSVGDNASYAVGVPLIVTVNADSNGRGVVAFDAIFQYDTSAFTLGSLSSSVVGFSAVSNVRRGYLEVTSSKDPQTTVVPVFKNTNVLTFTLVPQKVGNYSIRLIDKVGGSSTKFIDSNTKIFLPKTGSVSVTVK